MGNVVAERRGVISGPSKEGWSVARRYTIAETGEYPKPIAETGGEPKSFFRPVASYVVRTNNGEPTIHAVVGINRMDFDVGAQLEYVPPMHMEVLIEALRQDEAAESTAKGRFTFSAGKYVKGGPVEDRVK